MLSTSKYEVRRAGEVYRQKESFFSETVDKWDKFNILLFLYKCLEIEIREN